MGWYGDKIFFSVEAKFDDGAYGVPFVQEFHGHHGDEEDEHRDEEDEDHDHDEEDGDHDEEEDHDEDGDHHDEEGEEHGHEEEGIDRILLDSRRRNFRFTGGLRDLGTAIDEFVLKLSLTDWNHKEIEFFENGEQHVGTTFDQQEFVYRGVFEQKKVGPLSGRFGFWGLDREYSAVGEEALSPPIDQTGFAPLCPSPSLTPASEYTLIINRLRRQNRASGTTNALKPAIWGGIRRSSCGPLRERDRCPGRRRWPSDQFLARVALRTCKVRPSPRRKVSP